MEVPDVNHARSGDVAIAYQVFGAENRDIVLARGQTGDLLSTWEQPRLVRHVMALPEHGRVLMLDKRRTGLSDRLREAPSIETAMEDIRAVMDDPAPLQRGGLTSDHMVAFRVLPCRARRVSTRSGPMG